MRVILTQFFLAMLSGTDVADIKRMNARKFRKLVAGVSGVEMDSVIILRGGAAQQLVNKISRYEKKNLKIRHLQFVSGR